jgi:MFS family permease
MRMPNQPLLFLNLAHAYDHFFMLIFPTAVLALHRSWEMPYGDALALGTASFIAFGAGSLPAGWLGDRWSRAHMMSIFFIGLGISAILTGLAQGPLSLALALALLGLFASIYHPVATALVVQETQGSGRALGVNGVFGNMGVAAAALVTGLLAGAFGWRAAFVLPGLIALATGVLFVLRIAPKLAEPPVRASGKREVYAPAGAQLRVFIVVATTALCGGLVFHGTTVAMPKVFEERLADLTESLASIGLLVSLVFAFAAFAQIAVGHLLDRYGARPLLPAIAALQALCLLVASQLWGLGALVIALPLMLLVFGEIPINAWLIGRYAARDWHARIYAVNYLVAQGVSALAVPLIALTYGGSGGFAMLFLVLAGMAFAVALSALLLPRMHPRPQHEPSAALAHGPVQGSRRGARAV